MLLSSQDGGDTDLDVQTTMRLLEMGHVYGLPPTCQR